MKVLSALAVCLLCASVCFAGQGMGPGPGVKTYAAAGDSEVTFYFNCNSATSGQSPSKGSGTVTIGSNAATVTGQVGNGISNTTDSWGDGRVQFPVSGNMSMSVGTLGFWFYPSTVGAYVVSDNTGGFQLYWAYGTTYTFSYLGKTVSTAMSTGAWHFVELAWNATTDVIGIRIDNSSWSTTASATGSPPASTAINILGWGDNAGGWLGYADQIMVSSVYEKDLYTSRNSTEF